MALGIYFSPAAFTTEKYDRCIKRLKQAGAAHPPGRTFHSAFGPPERLMIFDLWTSQAAFERFGKTLMPILAEVGVDPGAPEIMTVHSVIKPPVRASKKKPARRAAPRRPKKR